METQLLRRFVLLAEELHFGRAAARSGVSQPRLSSDIARLEREVGAALFARTSRRTALTAAGALFEKAARRALDELVRGLQGARWKATGGQEGIAVGYVSAAMLMGLPRIVRAFRERNPAAPIVLRELSTMPQLERLADGIIDVAITSSVSGRHPLVCHGRWRDPFVLALPEDHSAGASGRRGALPLDAVRSEPFVLFPAAQAPEQHGEILAACARAGFAPDIVQEAEGWHAVLSLVAAGIGVSIAPSAVRGMRVAGVRFHPIAGQAPATSLALFTRPGPLPESLAAFVALADFAAPAVNG